MPARAFRRIHENKYESQQVLSTAEEQYLEKIMSLTKVDESGCLDDEVRNTPAAFCPTESDGRPMKGAFHCGKSAMAHNVGNGESRLPA